LVELLINEYTNDELKVDEANFHNDMHIY